MKLVFFCPCMYLYIYLKASPINFIKWRFWNFCLNRFSKTFFKIRKWERKDYYSPSLKILRNLLFIGKRNGFFFPPKRIVENKCLKKDYLYFINCTKYFNNIIYIIVYKLDKKMNSRFVMCKILLIFLKIPNLNGRNNLKNISVLD